MKKGFTLIELLVVVLIIGILSAIALPQYQTAVDKANYTSMMAAVRALKNEQELYYLANGQYTANIMDLSYVFPAECNNTVNCGKFALSQATPHYVHGALKRDKVGVGNALLMYLDQENTAHPIQCYAYKADGERGEKLCKSMGGVLLAANQCDNNCSIYELKF